MTKARSCLKARRCRRKQKGSAGTGTRAESLQTPMRVRNPVFSPVWRGSSPRKHSPRLPLPWSATRYLLISITFFTVWEAARAHRRQKWDKGTNSVHAN